MLLRPDRIVRSMVAQRYLTTTITEETFDGILKAADAHSIVLTDVVQIAVNGNRRGVDGDLWIPRPNVKYMQTINP